jgi:hypothetical protein
MFIRSGLFCLIGVGIASTVEDELAPEPDCDEPMRRAIELAYKNQDGQRQGTYMEDLEEESRLRVRMKFNIARWRVAFGRFLSTQPEECRERLKQVEEDQVDWITQTWTAFIDDRFPQPPAGDARSSTTSGR